MWKSLRLVGIAAVALLAAGFAFIHLHQWSYRNRAEELLNDLRNLELRRATFAEVRPLLQKWEQWGKYESDCTERNCALEISLENLVYEKKIFQGRWRLVRAYMLLGGRPARIEARIAIRNGVVLEKAYRIAIEVPGGEEGRPWSHVPSYLLAAEVRTVAQLTRLNGLSEDHPEYEIGKPSGCKVCLMVWFRFTPWAESQDIRRFMDIRLGCLSPWSACRTEADIMPVAWSQWLKEASARETNWSTPRPCSPAVLRAGGRDARNVAAVRVVAMQEVSSNTAERYYKVTVQIDKRLKRSEFWPEGGIASLAQSTRSLSTPDGAVPIRIGDRYLLLFDDPFWDPENLLLVEGCGLIPQKYLAFVEEGLRRDYEASSDQ